MIYLDNNALTPCDPEVSELIYNTLLDKGLANPSSSHAFGWRANRIYEEAKEIVADVYNALPDDVIFTSGASEANNQAILGTVQAAILKNEPRKKILVSAIEHKCVLNAALYAKELFKYEVQVIPVTDEGRVDLSLLREQLTEEVLLVSIMAVNNEIGTVQPYSEIGKMCREVGAIFHVDAAQAAYEHIDIIENNIDMLSISGGKLYGPSGVGVLIIDSMMELKPEPLIHGGLQQGHARSGTIPLYLCQALGRAVQIMTEHKAKEKLYIEGLRHLLIEKLREHNINFVINGSTKYRHPGNLNISLLGYSNHLIVQRLQPQFAVSTGAACNAGIIQQSYVLSALGLNSERIDSAIRIGIGRFNTKKDILKFAEHLAWVLKSIEN